MARHWKEIYDVSRHRNKMRGMIDGEYSFDFDYLKIGYDSYTRVPRRLLRAGGMRR